MNYAIGIIIILGIFSLFNLKNIKLKYLMILIIVGFLSFSYGVGLDWTQYKKVYQEIIPNLDIVDILLGRYNIRFEKGYLLINYFFYNLGVNYHIFMGIILMICNIVILRFIDKKTNNFYLGVLLSFINILFIYNMEPVVRQLISITIFIYSIKYIENRNFLKYFIFIYLATTFHKSAIICYFFYFRFEKIKMNVKKIIITSVIFYLVISNLHLILEILKNLGIEIGTYYRFLKIEKYGVGKERSFIGYIYIYIYTLINLIYLKKEKEEILLKNLSYCYIFINLFSNYFPIVTRCLGFFSIPLIICLTRSKINNKKIGILFLIFFNTTTFLYLNLRSEIMRNKYLYYKNYLFIKMFSEENMKKEKEYAEFILKLEEKRFKK